MLSTGKRPPYRGGMSPIPPLLSVLAPHKLFTQILEIYIITKGEYKYD